MSVSVEPNHPLAELLAQKLMGIEAVPTKEQSRMVAEAIREATKWARGLEIENKRLQTVCERQKEQLKKSGEDILANEKWIVELEEHIAGLKKLHQDTFALFCNYRVLPRMERHYVKPKW